MAEAVRRCVEERLAAEETAPTRATLVRDALSVAGAYADPDGASDVARRHDEIVTDSYRQ
jgi:hypothetical protein